ncbi:NERD domain-containing protein [Nocardia yunnanensis]|uniref:NERD domain-containing protein n=2 Tax=Nocardia yunnanensis TaxID=2382165 RepID=A0A386ZKG5_9NOCA|nr:NERD domain-containing protein [Nocardia yunnanensis]
MRVVNAARSGIPDTELQVISALRHWNTPGIVVSGAKVPVKGRSGKQTSAESDLLVILPHLTMALEVKGITERAGGLLHCPVQGDWSLPGVIGDPVHSQQQGNPREQVERVMYGFKNFAETITSPGIFVDGLVLMVGWPGLPLTLDKGVVPMPPGQDVMVFDHNLTPLRDWASRRARREKVWTAEKVVAVLGQLGFSETARDPDQRVTYAELVAAGFPTTTSESGSATSAFTTTTTGTTFDPDDYDPQVYAARNPAPAELSAAEEDDGPYGRSWNPPRDPRNWYEPAPPSAADPGPQAPAQWPRRRRQGGGGQLVRMLAAVAVALGLAAAAGAVLTPHHTNDPRPTITTTEDQAAPSTDDSTQPPAPTPTHPAGPAPCYPLQPGC